MSARIFTTDNCSACAALKKQLDAAGLSRTVVWVNVDHDLAARAEFFRVGFASAPSALVDGRPCVGGPQILAALRAR